MNDPYIPPPAKQRLGWLNVAVDYGPLLVFLAVYKLTSPGGDAPWGEVAAVIKGTIAFMIASLAALAISKWKLGRVSPGLILTTVLVVGFGGLTIWFNDPSFIQIKPTAIYMLFGTMLLVGWWRGKPLLRILLEAAFEGVDEEGWLKVSRNWGLFFFALAALNEVLRHYYNEANGGFETWLWAKLWVFMPLSLLFTFTQIPMLLRHGLALEDREEVVKDEPPTG